MLGFCFSCNFTGLHSTWLIVCVVVLWSIWLVRNEVVFNDKLLNLKELLFYTVKDVDLANATKEGSLADDCGEILISEAGVLIAMFTGPLPLLGFEGVVLFAEKTTLLLFIESGDASSSELSIGLIIQFKDFGNDGLSLQRLIKLLSG
ncbi:hypothetical protein V6N13_058379 [Hibiscus sabdariffa]